MHFQGPLQGDERPFGLWQRQNGGAEHERYPNGELKPKRELECELYGEGAEPGVVVHVDLFEDYLEPA